MIGDGWNGEEPMIRPESGVREPGGPARVAVVTGTRAEFGLLRPVMHAIRRHPRLELLVIASGAHLVMPAETFREIKREFDVADSVPMQIAGKVGRFEDVQSLGRGIARFGRSFDGLRPDWVLVLGDRIEAFAAASAGSIGGIAVAHVHGGDRAEGVSDESMRHAITKFSHLHCAATKQSAERIVRMGERPEHVHVVGSPAVDGLREVPEMADATFAAIGSPEVVFLMHPIGRSDEAEEHATAMALDAVGDRRVLAMHPNLDPGRTGVLRAIEARERSAGGAMQVVKHMPRDEWVGLLKRLAREGGVLVGNSSAGMIEASVLGLPAVNIGRRQAGREGGSGVIACEAESLEALSTAIAQAFSADRRAITHPFGDGRAGERIAEILAKSAAHDPRMLRKRSAY